MRDSKIEFTEEEALIFGRFLGKRYRNYKCIIRCLGGDVDPVNFGDKDQRSIYRHMAQGIGQGVSGNPNLQWNKSDPDWEKVLMTFHAVRTPALSGEGAEGGSSSIWFHEEPWLDFNMIETFRWTERIPGYIREDYQKHPTKPTVLGEGAYEGGTYKKWKGWVSPLRVRRQGYHTFFNGGAGYTYGHWSVWPFRAGEDEISWKQVLDQPGARQTAIIMHDFLGNSEIFRFEPNDTIIVSDGGYGEERQCAMLREDKREILIYFPVPGSAILDLEVLKQSGEIVTSRFNPLDGSTMPHSAPDQTEFRSPEDWQDAIFRAQVIDR